MACISRWTSNQSSVPHFVSQICSRTSGWKISAPPPGMLSMPAACSRSSTARYEMPSASAKWATSTAVSVFRWMPGWRCLRPRKHSSYQARSYWGCTPATMWISVAPCAAHVAARS